MINNKKVHIKEEKSLMSRIHINARKRPQLGLKECLENYELCVVPKPLFSVDGQLLAWNDKSNLIHHIEELADSIFPTNLVQEHDDSCIIINGMTFNWPC